MKFFRVIHVILLIGFYSPFSRLAAQSYTITDIAGAYRDGYSGDGGQATLAHLNNPLGVYADVAGNLYIADWGNSKIRVIDSSGIISTFAGNRVYGYSGDGGPATAAELDGPIDLLTDASGNLYISDIGNERIRKIDKNGIITTFAGNGKFAFGGDGGPAQNASFNDPAGMCTCGTDFYIADEFNNRIRKINSSGIITTVAGNGLKGYSGDGGPAIAARLYYPVGVATDVSGNLYIVDEDNNCIRKVDAQGIISTVAGNGILGFSGDGGAAINAELNVPAALAIDTMGDMFIADRNNERIRMVDTNGIMSTIAGNGIAGYAGSGGPATAAELSNPSSLVIDKYGNLYFSNPFNDHVQKLTPAGSEETGRTQVTVYPNPGTGLFTFNLTNVYGVHITVDVYDILGQKVFSGGLSAGNNQVNLVGKNKAVYIYRIYQYKNYTLSTGKLIVM